MSRRLVLGPFNRVEGDLEVALDIAGGHIRSAEVSSSLFRGFESMLIGKDPLDALVIVPRICGICSVAQSAAAASALADAAGLTMPKNGRLAKNLIQACENLADHLTHFYCFFMPDFARETYAGQPWHPSISARFQALKGSGLADFLPARAGFLRVMGYLAGKWPHTLALQPGGTTRAITSTEKVRLFAVLREFRQFVEQSVFADTLENVVALDTPAALEAWASQRDADFSRFLAAAKSLGLGQVGRAADHFLSFGAYEEETASLFPSGLWGVEFKEAQALDAGMIVEDVSHAWLAGDAPLPPLQGETRPLADGKAGAYSWCKAPRYAGQVVETGALARQVLSRHPLALGMVHDHGGSVSARVVARMLEVAKLLLQMENWLREIEPGESFCAQWESPQHAEGIGLVEAARGSLGHWLRIEQGKIAGYQIIAPTTWNFSPRDAAGQPGALEQALVGLPVADGDKNPVLVQHVVRSFDPCMVCTVH